MRIAQATIATGIILASLHRGVAEERRHSPASPPAPTVKLTQEEVGLLIQGTIAEYQAAQLAPAIRAAAPVVTKVQKTFKRSAP